MSPRSGSRFFPLRRRIRKNAKERRSPARASRSQVVLPHVFGKYVEARTGRGPWEGRGRGGRSGRHTSFAIYDRAQCPLNVWLEMRMAGEWNGDKTQDMRKDVGILAFVSVSRYCHIKCFHLETTKAWRRRVFSAGPDFLLFNFIRSFEAQLASCFHHSAFRPLCAPLSFPFLRI